jgi:hypothetical protein
MYRVIFHKATKSESLQCDRDKYRNVNLKKRAEDRTKQTEQEINSNGDFYFQA